MSTDFSLAIPMASKLLVAGSNPAGVAIELEERSVVSGARGVEGKRMGSVEARFAGKAAVVTGGASGIGLTVARRLAAEGAKVCVWAATACRLMRGEIQSLRLDLTDFAAVDDAARRTAEMLGGIDILVCSAGDHRPERDDVDISGRGLAERSSTSTCTASSIPTVPSFR